MPDSRVMELGATGRAWAIASPHALGTEAGAVAFERGGNAIDAALAAAVTLAVAYPHMCGVGGDLFALVQHRAGDVIAVNGSGRAPAGTVVDAARRAGEGRMPERGPMTVTVPGAVSGWELLHRQGADLPWADAFGRAIDLAHGGVAVSRSLAATMAEDPILSGDPGLREIFFPEGGPLSLGALFRQPALATTLEVLAARGPATLYGGDVGNRYAHGLRELAVPMTAQDLGVHTAELAAPLRARYRDLDVLVVPPNSQGFVLLEALAVIERMGIDPDPLGPDAVTLARILQAASRDRDLHLADPEAMRIHPSTLMDDGHLAAVTDEVHGWVSASPSSARGATGDTIALMTADAKGRAVSLIQSLFDGFGSGILEPSTGIVAQSRGACFTLEPDHANLLAPGKRPAHTLMPVAVQRDGRFEAVAGTMGGYAQPQIDAMTLIRSVDLAMGAAEAVAAPRWLVGRMEPGSAEPRVVAEASVPQDVRDALRQSGFRIDTELDGSVGHAHLIRAVPGGLEAGSDPRADGGAMAS